MNKESDQWITPEIPRTKNPACDLKRTYKSIFRISMVIAFVLHVGVGDDVSHIHSRYAQNRAAKPSSSRPSIYRKHSRFTARRHRHGPSIPIATESEDIPDDVTIETTDLDFDKVDLHVPPPPVETAAIEEPEEEILEYFMVEEKPVLIHRVAPVYPPVALKGGY